MAREASFNPIDEHLLENSSRSRKEYVTVSPKYGTLSFSIPYLMRKEMNGKFIKVKADVAKKAIFWKVIEGATNLDTLKSSRRIKIYESNGARTCTISIKKILKHMGISENEPSYTQLVIKKYDSTFLEDALDYVRLTKEKDDSIE